MLTVRNLIDLLYKTDFTEAEVYICNTDGKLSDTANICTVLEDKRNNTVLILAEKDKNTKTKVNVEL